LQRIDELPALPGDTVVINVAAYRYDPMRFRADQSMIFQQNTQITATLYRFCVDRGVTEMRQASSVAVYPAGTDPLDDAVPVDLNRPPHAGEAAYAWSRRFLEVTADLHRDLYGIHTQTFRLTNPYGPFDTLDPAAAHVATAFIIKALSEGSTFEIAGNPDAERDFVFAGDVAAVFAAACRRTGLHGAYNLAHGRTTAIRSLAETVLRAAGVDKQIVVTGTAPPGVNIRRATAQRLGAAFPEIAFHDLVDGMRTTVAWYRRALEIPGGAMTDERPAAVPAAAG
jgi:nucleoside-diphosphate-sugar epimerase